MADGYVFSADPVERLRAQRKQGGGDARNFVSGIPESIPPAWMVLAGLVAYDLYKAAKGRRR